jgi:hypothetical protein
MFTYTGDPSVSNRDKVRFLIGDTLPADPHFQDEEIAYMLSEWGDVYDAARAAAEVLAGRYAHKAQTSKSVGDLSISETYSSASEAFRTLARDIFEQKKRKTGSDKPIVRVNANSLKNSSQRSYDERTTDFFVGMQDNGRG